MSGMKPVDLYARVRYACHVEGLSQRETARRFGIDTKTVRKMLTFAVPPGYRRSKPPARPKLDPFTPIINRILEADRSAPPKQRHTAKRIYERARLCGRLHHREGLCSRAAGPRPGDVRSPRPSPGSRPSRLRRGG